MLTSVRNVAGPAEEAPTREQEEAKKLQINWKALNAEFTWEKLWTNRTWKDIFGHFAKVLFLTLIPTLVDVITDALSGKKFVLGNDYMKRDVNLSDPLNENCTLVGTYWKYGSDGEPYVEHEDWSCHEEDPVWGYVTLALIFVPGLSIFVLGSRFLAKQTKVTGMKLFLCLPLILILWLIGFSVFPLMLIGIQMIALFNPGREMDKVQQWAAMMEGAYESTFQFLLTVFIILSRNDRAPSNVQMASLVASLLTLVKYQIEQYLVRKHLADLPFMDKIPKAAVLLPMFLTNNIFKLGCIAVACNLLRYWAILVLPVTFCTRGWILGYISRRQGKRFLGVASLNHAYSLLISRIGLVRRVTHYLTPKETMDNLLYNNIAWLVIYSSMLTTIVTMATIQNWVESVKIFWQGPDYARNILVHDLDRLWAIYATIMLCGIISGILLYFQIWRPYKEEEEANSQVGFIIQLDLCSFHGM